jgi:hypothetical protein
MTIEAVPTTPEVTSTKRGPGRPKGSVKKPKSTKKNVERVMINIHKHQHERLVDIQQALEDKLGIHLTLVQTVGYLINKVEI